MAVILVTGLPAAEREDSGESWHQWAALRPVTTAFGTLLQVLGPFGCKSVPNDAETVPGVRAAWLAANDLDLS